MTQEELTKKLIEANKAYQCGNEIISDQEFDKLYSKLQKLEKKSGYILSNSPTQQIGFTPEITFQKIKHEYRVLSLDSTKDPQELLRWVGDENVILSWKCDGISIILTYEGGKLIQAATRGNGEIGEDVLHNALYFVGIPGEIKDKRHIVIRGEAVITFDIFNSINEELPIEKQYKNPRSMCAGAVRYLDASKSSNFNVHFMPFSLVNAKELGFTKVSESLSYISNLGLFPVDWFLLNKNDILDFVERNEEEVKDLKFATDGLVLVYDNLELHDQLGATAKYPKYAKAFKWADIYKMTILRTIEWSVSKNGLISPVAVFDPIELVGTTVKRANLHNLSIMKNLGLGIGNHISVFKANMMIPQIAECVEKTGNIDIPESCPVCNAPTIQRIGVNKRTEFLYCLNEECSARI